MNIQYIYSAAVYLNGYHRNIQEKYSWYFHKDILGSKLESDRPPGSGIHTHVPVMTHQHCCHHCTLLMHVISNCSIMSATRHHNINNKVSIHNTEDYISLQYLNI